MKAGTVPVGGAAAPARDGRRTAPPDHAGRDRRTAPSAAVAAHSRPSRLSAATRLCSRSGGTEDPVQGDPPADLVQGQRFPAGRAQRACMIWPRYQRREPSYLTLGASLPAPPPLRPGSPPPGDDPAPYGARLSATSFVPLPPARPAGARAGCPGRRPSATRRGTRTSGRRGSPGSGGAGDTDPGAEVHQALIPLVRPARREDGLGQAPGHRSSSSRHPAPPARRCAPGRAARWCPPGAPGRGRSRRWPRRCSARSLQRQQRSTVAGTAPPASTGAGRCRAGARRRSSAPGVARPGSRPPGRRPPGPPGWGSGPGSGRRPG